MQSRLVLELPSRPSLAQLAWVIGQVERAARSLPADEVLQLDAVLAQAREHLAAARGGGPTETAAQPEPCVQLPLAVSPRKAAQLLGIGHPLFFKEVMPLVYSGLIPSCRIGNRLVIPVASLRRWLDEAAHNGA